MLSCRCAACLIAVIAYFPNHPVHPPSEAAAAKRKNESTSEVNQNESGKGKGGLCTFFACCGNDVRESAWEDDTEHGDALQRLKSPRFESATKSMVFKYWIAAIAMGVPLGVSVASDVDMQPFEMFVVCV